jgi:kynurenine formamidase
MTTERTDEASGAHLKATQRNNWGRWGASDELGALNLIREHDVRKACRRVERGAVYSLGIAIQESSPRYVSRAAPLHLMRVDGGDYAAGAIAPGDVGIADDYVMMATHESTHIDALSHVWVEGKLYNGYASNEVRSSGAARDSIDKIPAIVGRGVLLDVAGWVGTSQLSCDFAIDYDTLEACAQAERLEVRPGDVVLIRTGWLEMFRRNEAVSGGDQPGLTTDAVRWFVERDVAAVGADNERVERVPDPAGLNIPVHVELLRNYGVHLMELMQLEQLAEDRVYEFLFVACPLKIRRAVGSPIAPIAIA